MEEQYKQLSTYVTRSVEKRIGAALYKTKMVRYDAFEGLGGELSFIFNSSGIALLKLRNPASICTMGI